MEANAEKTLKSVGTVVVSAALMIFRSKSPPDALGKMDATCLSSDSNLPMLTYSPTSIFTSYGLFKERENAMIRLSR